MPQTGNSGTVTFADSDLTLAWTKIGEYQQTRNKLPTDDLSTTGFKTYIADDHEEPGEIELEAYFDPTVDLQEIGGANDPEEVTITYPKSASTVFAASTLVGSAFLIAVGLPELVNGQVAKQKVKLAFDAQEEDPAFSVEVADDPGV